MIQFGNIEDGQAIGEAAGAGFNPATDIVFSNVKRGVLQGGVVVSGYTGSSVSLHQAGFHPGWLTRPLLWAVFGYVFTQLGCKRAFAIIPADNVLAIEISTRIGLKEEARLSEMFPTGDGVLLAMRADECKWVQLRTPPKPLFTETLDGTVQE